MREFSPILALLLIVSGGFSIFPAFAEENVLKPTIILSVKTDQGYYSPGYLDKYLTIPVVIMSEPSSLTPEREIPDDFLHL